MMLCLITAFQAEANPFIQAWKLKKEASRPFNIFKSKEIVLGISGPGKLNAASCVSYLGALFKPLVFLNAGIAGHQSLPLGECILAGKIKEASSSEVYYPTPLISAFCKTQTLITLEKPNSHYQNGLVFDMEAFGFFKAAGFFASSEFIQVFKIISDNETSPFMQITPKLAEELIFKNRENIITYADKLMQIAKDKYALSNPDLPTDYFLSRFHFSETEKLQLKDLLRRQKVLGTNTRTYSFCKSSKELLRALKSDIKSSKVEFNV